MGQVIDATGRFLARRKKASPIASQVDLAQLQKDFEKLVSEQRTERLRQELARIKGKNKNNDDPTV